MTKTTGLKTLWEEIQKLQDEVVAHEVTLAVATSHSGSIPSSLNDKRKKIVMELFMKKMELTQKLEANEKELEELRSSVVK